MAGKALHTRPVTSLLELINLVNLVPPLGLPDLGFPPGELSPKILTDWWKTRVAQLDPKLREFIGSVDLSTNRRYTELQQAAKVVREIARREPATKTPGREIAELRVSLMIDAEGKIAPIHNGLLQRLEGLDADGIRMCRCGQVFWATRKDKPTCGPACANARRVEKWRKKYPEKYKLQRYQHNEERAI